MARSGAVRFGVASFGVNEMNKVVKVNDDVTNGGQASVETELPYTATVKIRGTSDVLFHRWNADAVDTKANALTALTDITAAIRKTVGDKVAR